MLYIYIIHYCIVRAFTYRILLCRLSPVHYLYLLRRIDHISPLLSIALRVYITVHKNMNNG